MKNCTICGTALPDEAKYCSQCGARQDGAASPVPPGAAVSMGAPAAAAMAGTTPHGTVPAASAAPSAVRPAAASAAPSTAPSAAPSEVRPAAASKARPVPVYDRGVLNRGQPKGKRILVNILLAAALVALQVGLLVFFSGFADEETDMLTAQFVGFAPVVVLLLYIFFLDTIEKEPVGLLVKLFILEGAFGMTVVLLAEMGLDAIFSNLFAEYVFTPAYSFFSAVFLVGLVEELGKYIVLKRLTWKHPAFNYRFDGIVYAAVTALGFAAFENMAYVADSGLSVALLRTVSAVPGHCVDGILMGIFYGQAKCFEARGDRRKARLYRVLSIAAPVAEHGFYDFAANIGGDMAAVLFMGYVFLLNAVVFVAVWRLSQKDEAVAGRA